MVDYLLLVALFFGCDGKTARQIRAGEIRAVFYAYGGFDWR